MFSIDTRALTRRATTLAARMRWRALLVPLLALFIMGVIAYRNYPHWPDFPEPAEAGAPHAVFELGRDYGYHIGDKRQIDIFLKVPSGIKIQPESLLLTGDFEQASQLTVERSEQKSGEILYRLHLSVQSFQSSERLLLSGKIRCAKGSSQEEIILPETHIYMSNTWDGRQELQEGEPLHRHALYALLYMLAIVALVSIAYVLILASSIRAWFYSRSKEAAQSLERVRVLALIESVRDGSSTAAEHLILDGLVRSIYAIGPIPASMLKINDCNNDVQLLEFLRLSAPAIYSKEPLENDTRARLSELLTILLKEQISNIA